MILNVIQGAAQGLDQVDKVLPKASTETAAIRRGNLIVNDEGAWRLAMAADKGSATIPGPRLWVALNNDTDSEVEFAKLLAGLQADNGLIFETSAFATGLTLAINDNLTLADGGLYTNVVASGNTVYGQVQSLPELRQQMNRHPVNDDMFVSVVQVLSMYIPQIHLA